MRSFRVFTVFMVLISSSVANTIVSGTLDQVKEDFGLIESSTEMIVDLINSSDLERPNGKGVSGSLPIIWSFY